MAFDIHAEIRALKAANAADRAKAELLDKLFDSGRPLEAIEAFLDAFPGDICNISWYLPSAERLFKAELVTAYQPRHLKKLCEMLLERGYGFAMLRAAEIVTDSRIPANRRALFWHVIRSAEYMGDGLPGGAFAKGVFADNAAARRCWSRYGEDPDEKAFVGNTSVENRDKKIAAAMCAAAQNDSVSIMEIERTLRGGTAGVSLLLCMLEKGAAQCFVYLLSHYPARVFKLRSPEEWLFTVCRNASEKLAVAATDEIERQFPGIVASARDPWGNTLLWNTLANDNHTGELQAELIRLGCDPRAENEWGLSYQLVRDNILDKDRDIKRHQ